MAPPEVMRQPRGPSEGGMGRGMGRGGGLLGPPPGMAGPGPGRASRGRPVPASPGKLPAKEPDAGPPPRCQHALMTAVFGSHFGEQPCLSGAAAHAMLGPNHSASPAADLPDVSAATATGGRSRGAGSAQSRRASGSRWGRPSGLAAVSRGSSSSRAAATAAAAPAGTGTGGQTTGTAASAMGARRRATGRSRRGWAHPAVASARP